MRSSGGAARVTIRSTSGGRSPPSDVCSSTSTGCPVTGLRRVFPVSCSTRTARLCPPMDMVASMISPPPCLAACRNTRCSSPKNPNAAPSSTGQLISARYSRPTYAATEPGGQPQRQHQTAQPSGQQKKQRRQSPRMGLPPPRRQRHGGSPSRPAQRVRQPAKPRQEHRTGVQRPDGGAQSQPSSPQGDTRQLGRGQEQQIVYQQIQQEHPVQIHHRHAASPPSAGHIIPSAAGKKRQKKRGPHRSSPHVPHTPIPGRGFTGSGMAQ